MYTLLHYISGVQWCTGDWGYAIWIYFPRIMHWPKSMKLSNESVAPAPRIRKIKASLALATPSADVYGSLRADTVTYILAMLGSEVIFFFLVNEKTLSPSRWLNGNMMLAQVFAIFLEASPGLIKIVLDYDLKREVRGNLCDHPLLQLSVLIIQLPLCCNNFHVCYIVNMVLLSA